MKAFKTSCLFSLVVSFLLLNGLSGWSQTDEPAKAVPVILETDIGDDIDDTWALGLILKCPELDLKLVVGGCGKAQYRAKLLAKFLQTAGRSDVAVGVGLDVEPRGGGRQDGWLKDFDLKNYPGKVSQDGVKALIDQIMNSPELTTVIAIGPAGNLAEALKREPRIAQKARLVGMFGSLRLSYDGSKKACAEYNVISDIKACQKVFTAPWKMMIITPLDTCGVVVLDGERYRQIRDSKDPIASLILQNYRAWIDSKMTDERSTVLFDTVAVCLAITQDFCNMERIGLRIADNGFMVIDDSTNRVSCATSWKNVDAYRDFLVTRLTDKKTKPLHR